MNAGRVGHSPTCDCYQTSKLKRGLVIRNDDEISAAFLHYSLVLLPVRIVARRGDSANLAEIDKHHRELDAWEQFPI
jgi:hypothetical protein